MKIKKFVRSKNGVIFPHKPKSKRKKKSSIFHGGIDLDLVLRLFRRYCGLQGIESTIEEVIKEEYTWREIRENHRLYPQLHFGNLRSRTDKIETYRR